MAADQPAEISRVPDILLERLVTQHNIRELSVPIGRQQRNDRATIVCYRHFKSAFIRQCIKTDVLTISHTEASRAYIHVYRWRSSPNTRFASSKVSIEPTSYHIPGTCHT